MSDEARAKRSAVAGRRLYVCAGRLVASKRIDKVIDYVATEGAGARERDGRVLIVLGDGPSGHTSSASRRRGKSTSASWEKTSRRETLGWIGAADELVHASHVEGLSTVVREASLLGVPVTILA